jgi:hypothetical protein
MRYMSDLHLGHDARGDAPFRPRIVDFALVYDLATAVRDSMLRPLSGVVRDVIHVSPMSPHRLRTYEDDSGKHAAQP